MWMHEPRDRATTLLAFLLPLTVYLALPAAVMNGDGFGYYNRALSPDWLDKLSPGHLLYTPLLAGLGRAALALGLPPLIVMRLVNQLAGAGAIALLYATARRCGLDRLGGGLAAAGLAVSFGVWVQATDLEAYALPLYFVTAGLYAMSRFAETGRPAWAAAMGACTGLAALFHLVTATLGAAAVLLIIRAGQGSPTTIRDRERAGCGNPSLTVASLCAYLVTAAVVFGGPVLLFGLVMLRLPSTPAVVRWLLTADHGYPVPFGVLSLPRAAYGFLRTLIALDSFWTAPLAQTVLKAGGMLLGFGWLAWQWRTHRIRLSRLLRTLTIALVPFAALQIGLGVYYFGSDSERWVFLMPVCWLIAGAGAAELPARQRMLAALSVAALALVNLTQGIGPLATDRSTPERVRALTRLLDRPGVVVTPGHDWLSYFHFFAPEQRDTEILSLFLLAREHPGEPDAVLGEVRRRLDAARRNSRPVLLLRVLDPHENFHEDPWQMLAGLGLGPRQTRAWFNRFTWQAIALDDDARTPLFRLTGGPHDRAAR
jgi:hypothetical protein